MRRNLFHKRKLQRKSSKVKDKAMYLTRQEFEKHWGNSVSDAFFAFALKAVFCSDHRTTKSFVKELNACSQSRTPPQNIGLLEKQKMSGRRLLIHVESLAKAYNINYSCLSHVCRAAYGKENLSRFTEHELYFCISMSKVFRFKTHRLEEALCTLCRVKEEKAEPEQCKGCLCTSCVHKEGCNVSSCVDENMEEEFFCSECGCIVDELIWKYCPHCGAYLMEGTENDN